MDDIDFYGYQYTQLPCADCHVKAGVFAYDSERVAVMKDENGYYFKCVSCGRRSPSTRDKKEIVKTWNFLQKYRFGMKIFRKEPVCNKVIRALEVL